MRSLPRACRKFVGEVAKKADHANDRAAAVVAAGENEGLLLSRRKVHELDDLRGLLEQSLLFLVHLDKVLGFASIAKAIDVHRDPLNGIASTEVDKSVQEIKQIVLRAQAQNLISRGAY